jgi:outer membrane protein
MWKTPAGPRALGARPLLSLVLVLATAAPAAAETLADAIALAYRTNPTLQQQRAAQRVIDESYVQAHGDLRPTLNANAFASYQQQALGQFGGSNIGNVNLQASQRLYTSGRVSAAIDAAEANVLAGRETLRTVEAQVLQTVVQAYEDVRRDLTILGIRDKNVEVLRNQLEQTQVRFEVGQVTRTDVAQAEAQLAASRAQLAVAQSQLQNSRAAYATVVGQNPGELAPSPQLPGLPQTVDEAFNAAEQANGALQRARFAEAASRARVAQARATGRPTVTANALIGVAGQFIPFDPRNYGTNITLQGTVTTPIFAGGVIRSGIRAALEQNTADRVAIEGVRRQVVQSVAQAWNVMSSSRAGVTANEEQVRAATVAFTGIQEQYQVGISTILDVLVAQATLRDAELALAQSRRDFYVAQASLLGAMGRLEARSLVSGTPLYDPAESFDRVRNRGAVPWSGLIEALDGVGAPSTTATPPAAPVLPAPSGTVAIAPGAAPPAALSPTTSVPIATAQ